MKRIVAGSTATRLQGLEGRFSSTRRLCRRRSTSTPSRWGCACWPTSGDFLEFPQSGFTVSDATLKNKRELIKRLLRGTLRGLQFTLKNRAETVRFIAKDYKLQEAVADKVYTSLLPAMSENGLATDKGLKVMIETLGTAVGKNVDFPPERLVDYTFVERSAKRIGRAVKGRSLMSASNRAIVFLSLLFPVAFCSASRRRCSAPRRRKKCASLTRAAAARRCRNIWRCRRGTSKPKAWKSRSFR